MTKGSKYAQQIIIIQAGTMKLGWVKLVLELSEVKLTEFHCK